MKLIADILPSLSVCGTHRSSGMLLTRTLASTTRRPIKQLLQSSLQLDQPTRNLSAASREFPAQYTNLDGTRGVLRLGGADVISFLQGLLTNDANPLQRPGAEPLYAALLNAQGRYLHDMFLHRQPGSELLLLADVDHDALPELKKILIRYRLRSKVDIADVSDEYSVWVRFGAGRLPDEAWPSDPRLEALGQRVIMGKLDKPTAPDEEPETDSSEYCRWRIEHGVAEGDTEIPSGQAMPLEYNLDALNGVSYTKGCYVGQELVARTNNRGVVRKRLMPVVIEGGEPEVGADIIAESLLGKPDSAGKMRLVENKRGLAHLRLKHGLADSGATLKAGDATVTPWRPSWWPSSWGHEEETQQ